MAGTEVEERAAEPAAESSRPRPTPSETGAGLAGSLYHWSRRLRRIGRMLLRPWRRSLLLRVASITVLLGLLMTLAVGSYMYQRIADGLVAAKTRSAEQTAQQRLVAAQTSLSALRKTDTSTLYLAAKDLVQQAGSLSDDSSRQVVFTRAVDNASAAVPTVSSGGASPAVVPAEIKRALAADPEHQQSMIVTTELGGADSSPRRVPAVLIGARLAVPNAGAYDLYMVFPMEREIETLSIVRQSFLLGGLGLVLLLGGLSAMVTRMVVTPIRGASHVAQRLAAGALNERMRVHGEDDLARLATSFNAMADSLQRQIRALEDLSVVQQRFTSDVSHELRTPLTTIRMAGDLLHSRRADFSAPVARSAELLHKELDRFEALLTDLLEISRFDAGAADLEVGQVDLVDLTRRVVEASTPLATRLGVELRVTAPEPCVAQMDARRVERIVRNLVSNSVEHGDGRPIDVVVGGNTTAVAVAVRDYGVGLRPGDASMVFNRFWRADPARARTTGGTGLGLSISLEDARLHDGWLQAWGEPGAGSCFRLTLPRTKGRPIRRSPVTLADHGGTAEQDDAARLLETS